MRIAAATLTLCAVACGTPKTPPKPEPVERIRQADPTASVTVSPIGSNKPATPTPPHPARTSTTVSVSAGPTSDHEALILRIFGPKHGPRAVRIARCESRLNPTAISPTGDYGLLQINRNTWERKARELGWEWPQMLEPEPNVRMAHWIFKRHGWKAWTCAKKVA